MHWLDPDWKQGWGLGFRVMRERDATWIGHGGWAPGYRAQMLLCPADRTGVIVLSNAHDCDPVCYCDRAFQWVLPAVVARKAPEPRPATPDPGWQRYVGRYRDAWNDTQVLVHKLSCSGDDSSVAAMNRSKWNTVTAATAARSGEPVGGEVLDVRVHAGASRLQP